MKFSKFAGAVVVAGLVVVSSMAFADTRTWQDPDDAPAHAIDIREYGKSHNAEGKLVHKVKAFDRFDAQDAFTMSHLLTTFNASGEVIGRYQLAGDGAIYHLDTDQQTGQAVVKRPDGKTIRYVFGKGAIGRPAYYKFFIRTSGDEASCGEENICDRAPDAGQKRHNL